MKKAAQTMLLVSLALIVENSYAGSATWKLNPTDTDWNSAANWTPATIPDGQGDVATFSVSNTTNVSLERSLLAVNSIVFSSGASAFTLTVGDPADFFLSVLPI